MKLGCHAVLFAERLSDEPDFVVGGLSKTGFSGIEIGSRFFAPEKKEQLVKILDKYETQLSGVHITITLNDWADSPDECVARVLNAAKVVCTMKNKNVVLSGKKPENPETAIKAARGINGAVLECIRLGVKLNYHNHAWEFMNNSAIFNMLYENAPALNFAFDLGWIDKAGANSIELLGKCAGRVSYVHIRDLDKKSGRFVELGSGDTDLSAQMSVLKSVPGMEWAIVEYEDDDDVPQDMSSYLRAREYMAKML